jgi:replicative DNA helicase
MIDRVPPYSEEAEASFLGSLLIPGFAGKIIEYASRLGINEEWFYSPANRLVWNAIVSLIVEGTEPDGTLVINRLTERKQSDKIGGIAYIERLIESCSTPAHGGGYADILKDKHAKRCIIQQCRTAEESAYSDIPAEQIASTVNLHMMELKRKSSAPESFSDIVDHLMGKYRHAQTKGYHGLPIFLFPVQNKIGGLPFGETTMLAARPSMGKSTFMLNQSVFLAMRNIPCGVISLEMSRARVYEKCIGAIARLNIAELEHGGLTPQLEAEFMNASSQVHKLPLYVADGRMTIEQICVVMQDMVAEHNVQFIGLDYIQLLTSSTKRNSRNEEVGYWSNTLHTMARDLNVHLMILSQLSRTKNKVPIMSDLRDSGALEQDADMIAFLHPDWMAVDDADIDELMALPMMLRLEKSRYGQTGKVAIQFVKNQQRFETSSGIIDQTETEVPF